MKKALLLGMLLGAGFITFRNTLPGEFVYDDRPIIVKNSLIRSLNIPAIFGSSYWGTSPGQHIQGAVYRPLTILTYALNYRAGLLNPAGYHAVNLWLHIGVAFLLGLWCLRLGLPQAAAMAAALFYVVLPVHTEAVSNIVGRAEMLAAFFVLLSWILVLGRPRRRQIAAGVFFYALALLSKENAAAFLPVLILSDYVIRRKSWQVVAQERLLIWVAYGGCLFLYLQWRYLILGSVASASGMPYFISHQAGKKLFTMASFTVAHYLKPLILGTGLCAEYTRPALTDSSFQDWRAWLCLFFLSAAIGYSLYSVVRKKSLGSFSVLIFFALLLPASNLLIPLEVIGAERFLYLPSIGYSLGLGVLVQKLLRKRAPRYFAGLAALAALMLWYGWATYQRNKAWKTEASFWETTVQDAPRSPRAWNGLGMVRMNEKKYDEALGLFQKALALNPMLADAHYNTAECYFLMNRFTEAKKEFLKLLDLQPFDRDTLVYLAVLAEKDRDFRSAAAYYAKVLTLNPLDRTAGRNLALMHCRMGDLALCRQELTVYLEHRMPEEHNEDIRVFLEKLR